MGLTMADHWNSEDPIYALAQRIPLKQGSLVLWDQTLGCMEHAICWAY